MMKSLKESLINEVRINIKNARVAPSKNFMTLKPGDTVYYYTKRAGFVQSFIFKNYECGDENSARRSKHVEFPMDAYKAPNTYITIQGRNTATGGFADFYIQESTFKKLAGGIESDFMVGGVTGLGIRCIALSEESIDKYKHLA